jgi:peptide/nickel transport system ATP-binding protein
MTADILRVRHLQVYYDTPLGTVRAVNDISLSLKPGERLGLAGESGSGKSTLALSILRLLKPPGRIAAGEVWLDGINLLSLPDEEIRRRRLAEIALIPQGSMNSLNPVMQVEAQIADAL